MGITGDKLWKIQREDGLTEYDNGDKAWYLNGKLHREDGPAAEFADGTKMWHRHGELHREDGPAVEVTKDSSFRNQWFLNDIQYSKRDFLKATANKEPKIENKEQIVADIKSIRQTANSPIKKSTKKKLD